MDFRLALLRQSRTFWLTLALFAIGNAWSILRYSTESWCCTDEKIFGFPFPFYVSDTAGNSSEFLYFGFLLNLVLAITVAIVVARIALHIGSQSNNRQH